MKSSNRNDPGQTEAMHKSVLACTHRHLYHVMPPQGWMNDPNGFVFFSQQYHLFYQFNPYAPKWDLMHWGHCYSKDLVQWQYLPPALTPDQSYDVQGCYSGSSIVHDDLLYLFYTGVDASGNQTQCLATSHDGLTFEKHPGNPVVSRSPNTVNPREFRDPCVFKRGERFFMIVGAQSKHNQGQAIVYASENLIDWNYLNTITAGADALGSMWECPDLFFLEDKAILILSPQGITDLAQFDSDHDCGYYIGRFHEDTGTYTHGCFHKLDMGFDFYAPQTSADPSGRQILIAWMSRWDTPSPTSACQWAGSMTLPRDVRLRGNRLVFSAIPEIMQYMKLVIASSNVISGALLPLQASTGRLRIISECKDFSILVFCSADGQEYTSLSYQARTRSLCLDLCRSGESPRGQRCVNVLESQAMQLDIYLDRSSIEVFINNGDQVMTARTFPHPKSDGIRFQGSAVFHSIYLWAFYADSVTE